MRLEPSHGGRQINLHLWGLLNSCFMAWPDNPNFSPCFFPQLPGDGRNRSGRGERAASASAGQGTLFGAQERSCPGQNGGRQAGAQVRGLELGVIRDTAQLKHT